MYRTRLPVADETRLDKTRKQGRNTTDKTIELQALIPPPWIAKDYSNAAANTTIEFKTLAIPPDILALKTNDPEAFKEYLEKIYPNRVIEPHGHNWRLGNIKGINEINKEALDFGRTTRSASASSSGSRSRRQAGRLMSTSPSGPRPRSRSSTRSIRSPPISPKSDTELKSLAKKLATFMPPTSTRRKPTLMPLLLPTTLSSPSAPYKTIRETPTFESRTQQSSATPRITGSPHLNRTDSETADEFTPIQEKSYIKNNIHAILSQDLKEHEIEEILARVKRYDEGILHLIPDLARKMILKDPEYRNSGAALDKLFLLNSIIRRLTSKSGTGKSVVRFRLLSRGNSNSV